MEYNLSCRTILYLMILSGAFLHYMLKVSPNLVLVEIVRRPSKLPSEIQCKNLTNVTSIALDTPINSTINYKFGWSEYEQGLMLSAYYWIHPFMEIPGGVLTKKYGAKLVFGTAMLFATLLGYFLPLATKHHPYVTIFIRVMQGTAAGVAFPSTHSLIAQWVPHDERSKFISAYLGTTLAITATYAVSGYIIHYLGWESVFYVTSSLGALWFVLWMLLVYDSPSQHPRISRREKKIILDNIGESTRVDYYDTSIPWKKILASGPMWVAIIGSWSFMWGSHTLLTQAPIYFSVVHGWNIRKTGVLAGLPFVLTFAFAFIFGNVCDCLLKSGKISRTNVRKLATFVSHGVAGLMIFGLAFSGCDSNQAFFFMLTGSAIMGAISSGSWANCVDLSPNYASVIFGISGFISNSSGFISPIVAGILTYKNQTIGQWQIMFVICASVQWFGCIIYSFWAEGDEQEWNNHQSRKIDNSAREKIEINPR